MLKYVFLFIILCSVCNAAYCQTSLKGVVTDKETQQVLPYCSVYILHTSVATITNEQGEFELYDIHPNDTVEITHIGYAPTKESIEKIYHDGMVQFSLNASENELPAAEVQSISPLKLLSIALAKSDKLLLRGAALNTYYREYLKINGSIKKFSDGLVDLFVPANKDEMYINVVQSRNADDIRDDEKNEKRFNDIVPIKDFVEKYFPYHIAQSFKSENYPNFIYKWDSLNSPDYFVIDITPGQNNSKSMLQLKVYIDKQDTLLSSVETKLLSDKKGQVAKGNIISRATLTDFNQIFQFRKMDNHLVLSYGRLEFWGHIKSKIVGIDWNDQGVSEMIVNNFNVNASETDFESKQYKKKFLYENGNHYQSKYWENNNIIKGTPEEIEFMNKIENRESK